MIASPINVDPVREFLADHHITLSDTIRICERLSNGALDGDLVPLAFNTLLVEQLRNSEIEDVFFTSGAGKNGALRTFYTGVLKKKFLPTQVAKSKNGILPVEIFGRDIRYTVLYSPAATANRGIMKSQAYKQAQPQYEHHQNPVHAYKVDLYRNAFGPLINTK